MVLSKAERQFLKDLLNGDTGRYSYHYKKVLKKRILGKRKQGTEDLALISRAEDMLEKV